MAADLPLADSANLVSVPAIDGTLKLVVTPASYATAAAMINGNPTILDFLLSPGDYRSWGTFELLNKAGGVAGRPRTIRYYNPGVDDTLHPVARVHQAQLDTIKVSGTTHDWLMQGLWVNNPTDNNTFDQGANTNTWDKMLIERCKIYSCRIRQAPNTCVQRCVIRESYHGSVYPQVATGDSTGIQVAPPGVGVIGIQIIDNEIYNCGDAIQFTPGTENYDSFTQVLIEGNDLYFNSDVYVGATNQSFYENCIDMKAGGTATYPTIIRNNRLWGSRRNATTPTPSSLGELLVVQEYCKFVTITGNIFADSAWAVKDESWFPNSATTYTVDSTTDIFTKSAHGLVTGQGPFNPTTPTGTLPGGIVLGGQYWVIKLSSSTFKVATSYADSLAGTALDITSNGTGTNKFRIDPTNSRNITVDGNQFCDIRDRAALDAGATWKPLTNIAFTNNYISRCTYLCDVSPPTYYNPTFTGNALTDVDNIQRPEVVVPALPYDPLLNTSQASLGAYRTYERRRWTGPEIVEGAISYTPDVPVPPDPIVDNPEGNPPVVVDPPPVIPDPPVYYTVSHRGQPRFVTHLGSVSHRAPPVTHGDDE